MGKFMGNDAFSRKHPGKRECDMQIPPSAQHHARAEAVSALSMKMRDIGVIIVRVAKDQDHTFSVCLPYQQFPALFLERCQRSLRISQNCPARRRSLVAEKQEILGFITAIIHAKVFLPLQQPLLCQLVVHIPPILLWYGLKQLLSNLFPIRVRETVLVLKTQSQPRNIRRMTYREKLILHTRNFLLRHECIVTDQARASFHRIVSA